MQETDSILTCHVTTYEENWLNQECYNLEWAKWALKQVGHLKSFSTFLTNNYFRIFFMLKLYIYIYILIYTKFKFCYTYRSLPRTGFYAIIF